VAGRVGDDEVSPGGGEIAVGDVDRDALLALRLEAVGEQGEVDLVTRPDAGAVRPQGRQLVLVDRLGVVQEAPDERGLPVVDAPQGGEPQEVLRRGLLDQLASAQK